MLACELCGGEIVVQPGGKIVCEACGMKYSKERIREMLSPGGAVPPPAPSARCSTLSVERDKSGGCVAMAVSVTIDGAETFKLNYGESVQISLAEGKHTVSFKNVYSTNDVNIDIAQGVRRCKMICKVGFSGRINAGALVNEQ